ncbi:ImpA family type VI secretion system protein [Paraburkholderia sp. J12]|uniref:type VI secretion system protein TssA n=1 Tax=Paraburkholderia sp. J12 TaxID=2805432 RepID=UPI002ABE6FDF|nr:type VI secretion system ImpA family N-terminal domain-containing protein [Paraburkholderia sp. J12]
MNAHSPAAALRYADLLEPVCADAPCGAELDYDQDFVMLLAAAAPRVEAQYGNFVGVPQAANWAEIERDCRTLLLRAKDIRLAVILLRCRIRLDGAAGLRDGLAFLKALLDCYGEALHPQPIFEGERDPVIYANALAALADPDGPLGDMRDIVMPKATGVPMQFRDIEKSFSTPRLKDALAPESVSRLLKELWGRRDAVIVACREAQHLTADIVAWCDATLGTDAPDLSALSKMLQPFSQAQLDGGAPSAMPATVPMAASPTATTPPIADTIPTTAPAATTSLSITQPDLPPGLPTAVPVPRDRWSALAAIQETRIWFEQNEPSSPVIVLLRQSERMVGKRFSELARLIPADLLAAWDPIED